MLELLFSIYPWCLTVENFRKAKCVSRHKPPRLCGDLGYIREHLASLTRVTRAGNCEICNAKTLWKCSICNKRMCVLVGKQFHGTGCAIQFHDDSFFGLARRDNKSLFFGTRSSNQIASNAGKVNAIKRKIAEEDDILIP